ncbi:MAG TPA: ABC transporter substrate-binding protein, partial [Candidatus Methylomirabilis sp.]|nr:ABC transporter substrate-binding protein [Candidatus Methylomirabilis sp.]
MRGITRWIGPVLLTLLLVSPALAQTTFIFGAEGEPVCLDASVVTDGVSQRVISQIVEGLVKYKGSTTEVVPALAEKWQVSADGTVWTFTLQKNVKYHDGAPFDASVVVWNFERWRFATQPQHENMTKAGQTFEYYEAQFGGFDDKSLITKVEAVNPTTVRITLKSPQGPFLNNLAMFAFVLPSPKAVEQRGVESCKYPVGTGPFKFVEWKPNQEVVLEANKDYWDKANAPKVQRVIIRNIKDNSQRLAALKAGEIHGMFGVNPDDVKVVRADPNLQILLRPTNNTGYVAFNYKVKEFKDKRVRQAVAQAINKKAVVDALYGGLGLVAKEFQPPSLWGYNKDL